jgi:ribonucleoside-diphosphate reductase beta chain
MFETSIHSKSYSHIIRNIYNVPKIEFDRIHETKEIIEMAANIGHYYEDLHQLNCAKEIGQKVDILKHKKAIWLALNASYALEAFRFMVSFATSLAMVENKIYIGNGNIISLILQDELLHTEWTAWLINNIEKDDEDFIEIKTSCKDEVYQMYMDVIKEEKDWAEYLFSKGVVIGLNANILKDFVDYTAFTKLKDIGVKYAEDHPRSSPIPWFNKHTNISKKQSALQETESTNYVIGVMSTEVSLDELPDL